MSSRRLIVIGGDAAGMSAASQARRHRSDLDILVFEKTPHTSYSAWGIPYYIGRVVDDEDSLVARTPEEFRQQGIEVQTLHEVVEIDISSRRVRVRQESSKQERWESYDDLMIATGARPFAPEVPGHGYNGIFGISNLQSGINARQYIEREKPKTGVIIGGGYIGLEMAEALVALGLDVSLVEKSDQIIGSLDKDMAASVSAALERVGVKLYLEESLLAFEGREGKINAVTTDKRKIAADIVILGMGVSPNTSLAATAGITLGVKGAIRVNERMQTETPGIWAAGDCAESFHLVSRKPVFIPLGTIANKHGRVAGINLGGEYATFPGVVGTAVTKICSVEVGRTGLHEREIRQLGLEYVSAKIDSKTKIGYFPDSGKITVKVLAEKGSGRLLGAQIVGAPGSAKRIDAFAVALHAGFNLEQLINLDLGYAPPFSPVWDAAHIAAREALKKV